MDNDIKKEKADKVFATICKTLEMYNFNYRKDEKKYMAAYAANAGGTTMKTLLTVDPERYLITLYAPLHIKVPEDKKHDMAYAINIMNKYSIIGCIRYDLKDGELIFKVTESYLGCFIGRNFIHFIFLLFELFFTENRTKLNKLIKDDIYRNQFLKGNAK